MDVRYTISQEPYPGLRSFQKDENDIFFGRDDHVDDMVAKLAETHFLCVTGPSGCGKSSLARTGLMNHLEAGFLPGRGSDWIFCDMSPGDRPIDRLIRNLANAIVAAAPPEVRAAGPDLGEEIGQLFYHQIVRQRQTSDLNQVLDSTTLVGGRPILILVDQFEELFRYARSDPDAAVNFVEILLRTAAAKRDVYIVITIRTDQLEKCSRYPGLTRMINESQFLTPALDRYQIQEAIDGPIALWGGAISPAFSTWLLNCLEEELDKLPLMQHALKILYAEKSSTEGRRDVTIDVGDFIRVFRIDPAVDLASPEGRLSLRRSLSDRLTDRLDSLPAPLRPAAKRAFCALTAVESQNRDIRRPRTVRELAQTIGESLDDTRTIVRSFSTGDETYLRCSAELEEGDTVDVTHECILRLWSPLQTEWLVDEKRSADHIMHLARLARDWEEGSERSSPIRRLFAPAVLRGRALDRYRRWFAATRPNAAWAARYLANVDWPAPSGAAEQKLKPEDVFERIVAFFAVSTQHRRRNQFALGFGAVAGVLIVAFIVYQQFEKKRAKAEFADILAKERVDLLSGQIIRAGLPPEEARVPNLVTALRVLGDVQGRNERDWIQQAKAALWMSLQSVKELYRFKSGDAQQDEVHAADFAADGKSVLTVDFGGRFRQWAVSADHQVMREFVLGPLDKNGVPAQGRSLRVSPLGDVAAVGFSDGSVVMVNLTPTGKTFEALQIDGAKPHGGSRFSSVFGLVFSSDGSLLVTSSRAGNVAIWERSAQPPDQSAKVADDPLQWTLKRNINLNAKKATDIWAVDIDREKQTIAVGLGDGRVCLFGVDSAEGLFCSRDGHAFNKIVKSVKFQPNKPVLVSAGNDAKVTIWDLDLSARTAKPWPIALYHENALWDLDFSRDGSLLATASWDGSVRVYQTDIWRQLITVAADKDAPIRSAQNSFALRTARFDPTSSMLVTASLDHTARIWTPLNDRTSFLDLSYRLSPLAANSVRRIPSVAIAPTGDWIAFTDGSDVFVRSSNQTPKTLPLDTGGLPLKRVATRDQATPAGFSQLLIPFDNRVVASGPQPALAAWTRSAGGEWASQIIPLPGDAIASGRSMAVDPAGAMVAVEVREDERASVLLCPLQGSGQELTCPVTGNSKVIPLPFEADGKPCASRASRTAIAFSKNGRLIATAIGNCPIHVVDMQTGEPERLYGGYVGGITSLDFSPDEKSFVSTSDNFDVRLWNLASRTSKNINYHTSPFITAARYTRSGQWIVSTSHDNTTIIADVEMRNKPVTLTYRNSLLSLDMVSTPRGIMMATGSEAGDVNVMRFFEDPKDVYSYAAVFLRDNLAIDDVSSQIVGRRPDRAVP